jgi:hypothetical protein
VRGPVTEPARESFATVEMTRLDFVIAAILAAPEAGARSEFASGGDIGTGSDPSVPWTRNRCRDERHVRPGSLQPSRSRTAILSATVTSMRSHGHPQRFECGSGGTPGTAAMNGKPRPSAAAAAKLLSVLRRAPKPPERSRVCRRVMDRQPGRLDLRPHRRAPTAQIPSTGTSGSDHGRRGP